ncbi:hypothetical protein [Paracoccus sp. ME4]
MRCGAEHADFCVASRLNVTLGPEELLQALEELEAALGEAAPSR